MCTAWGLGEVRVHTRLIMRRNRATRLPSFIKTGSSVNLAVQGLRVRVCILSHVTLETPEFVCRSRQRTAESHNRDHLTIQVHSMKPSWRKHIIYTLARRNWAWDAHTVLRPQMDAALSLREPRPAFGLSFAFAALHVWILTGFVWAGQLLRCKDRSSPEGQSRAVTWQQSLTPVHLDTIQ